MPDINDITYIERLVTVETTIKNLTDAVNKNGDETKEALKDINDKLDMSLPTFVTIEQHNRDINALRKRTWVQNTLSAVTGATLSILIAFFFTHI